MLTSKRPVVLVAEKAQDARSVIREVVTSLFKTALVIEAQDGGKLLMMASKQPIDLVIAAQKLPVKEGAQLLKGLAETEPKMKPKALILLTEPDFKEEWKKLFTPMICAPKPLEAATLKTLIQEISKAFS